MFRPLSIWRGSIGHAPPRLYSYLTLEEADAAIDDLVEIENWLSHRVGHSWYRVGSMGGPKPLEDNFSERQAFLEDDGRYRFDVNLWATIDGRLPALSQLAVKFRQMAKFLESQAAVADEKMKERKRHRNGAAANGRMALKTKKPARQRSALEGESSTEPAPVRQ
jgi:hypothetical protein